MKKKYLASLLVCTAMLTALPYTGATATVSNGWESSNGSWYYYQDGSVATGWVYCNGNWYYLNSDGAMATGWKNINGNWYYLNSDGAMAKDTTIDGYYVNSSGVWSQAVTKQYTGLSYSAQLQSMGFHVATNIDKTAETEFILNPYASDGSQYQYDQIAVTAYPNGQGDETGNNSDMVLDRIKSDADTVAKFDKVLDMIMPGTLDEIHNFISSDSDSTSIGGRTITKLHVGSDSSRVILALSPIQN